MHATPTTRRSIVRTGAKLAYAAPLVATSLTLSATNAAAAVSLGSRCAAGSVFFSTVVLSDPEGNPRRRTARLRPARPATGLACAAPRPAMRQRAGPKCAASIAPVARWTRDTPFVGVRT